MVINNNTSHFVANHSHSDDEAKVSPEYVPTVTFTDDTPLDPVPLLPITQTVNAVANLIGKSSKVADEANVAAKAASTSYDKTISEEAVANMFLPYWSYVVGMSNSEKLEYAAQYDRIARGRRDTAEKERKRDRQSLNTGNQDVDTTLKYVQNSSLELASAAVFLAPQYTKAIASLYLVSDLLSGDFKARAQGRTAPGAVLSRVAPYAQLAIMAGIGGISHGN